VSDFNVNALKNKWVNNFNFSQLDFGVKNYTVESNIKQDSEIKKNTG